MRFPGRLAPPAHEAKQEARGCTDIAVRPVKGQEAIPDDLRVDVPALPGGLRSLDQRGPTGLENVQSIINVDLFREYSFVIFFTR